MLIGGGHDCVVVDRLPEAVAALLASALPEDPHLTKCAGWVSDSGEGRWTVKGGIDQGVPTPLPAAALYERFSSRGNAEAQHQVLSAVRCGFGGHLENPAG
jgi:6-phosphogluconate dehydrogenase